MLNAPAPHEAAYGPILRLLAAAGDKDAQRLFAICVDVTDADIDVMEEPGAVQMIADAHDY